MCGCGDRFNLRVKKLYYRYERSVKGGIYCALGSRADAGLWKLDCDAGGSQRKELLDGVGGSREYGCGAIKVWGVLYPSGKDCLVPGASVGW